jgi:hypothetical protein
MLQCDNAEMLQCSITIRKAVILKEVSRMIGKESRLNNPVLRTFTFHLKPLTFFLTRLIHLILPIGIHKNSGQNQNKGIVE